MKIRHLLPLVLLASAAAHSAPLPNLVLSCPDENAIDQPFDACHGYIYEIPTNERIVVSSSYIWRKAADLAGYDLLVVCMIPVEPGAYSSCRDSAGIRRTAFVPKGSVIMGGRSSVIVSKTGGDYTDPVTAAENAFAGDTWCVAPQWPLEPCVMAIGEGIFILSKTLSIPEGLAVSGNGKGDTMLVADNGVQTAVVSDGNVRISDLTIVNSQPGVAQITGLDARPPSLTAGFRQQLHNVAIHVSGAAQNVGVTRSSLSLEVLDSEITAVGPDATGIFGRGAEFDTEVRLERSHVSAETALQERVGIGHASIWLTDSHIFGTVEHSLLEIVRSGIVGNVTAKNDHVSVIVTDSSIKGDVDINALLIGQSNIRFTNANVEGSLSVPSFAGFTELVLRGELFVHEGPGAASFTGSYIVSSNGAAPAITLTQGLVELQRTFVQGAIAGAGSLSASSSVLAGALFASVAGRCSDSYGADYELLDALCQPQP